MMVSGLLPAGQAQSPTQQWILACQNKDGGFGLYPGDGSNLLATFSAVQALKLLGETIPFPDKVASFILTKQTPAGGFCNRFGNRPDQPVLQMTFYAVSALAELGRLPKDTRAIADWIHAQQLEDGGFSWDYFLAPDIQDRTSTRSAYYAVMALSILGQAPKKPGRIIALLHKRQTAAQRKDGGFSEQTLAPDGDTPQAMGLVWFTGMGLETLRRLNATCAMPEKAASFLRGAQRPGGGIGKGLGIYRCFDDLGACRMQEAYYAALGLSALGAGFTDGPGLEDWIKGCLRSDGGFGRRPEMCPADLEATYQALSVLSFLKASFPSPGRPLHPKREGDAPVPEFACHQVNSGCADENRYLYRIAKPIYDENIGQGGFAVAKALMLWVSDNLLFCSNYNHSGAQTIIDGLGTCSPQGRAYASLANAVGLESRVIHIFGHGLAETRINGKWVMMDPIFVDWGRNETGQLQSALDIHENFLDKGRFRTRFGDWRYETFEVERPDGSPIRIERTDRIKDAVMKGAYE